MATLYAIERTKSNNVPQDLRDQGSQGGRVHVLYDKYTAAGALANADIIKLGKLPLGARVIGYWLKSADLGTTGTCSLGYAASADAVEAASAAAFLLAVDLNAAAITIGHQDQENMTGLGKKFLAEVEVQIAMTAATTAAGSIEVCISYVID